MKNTKLILVEGLPGSGKTSTARYVKKLLDERHIPNQLFLEGDLEHPADYEAAAYLTEAQFEDLLQRYKDQESLLRRYSEAGAGGIMLYYGKLAKVTDAFEGEDFGTHDVYNLPLAQHQLLILQRWSAFAERAVNGDEVYILECCFLQNPMTVMLVRDNRTGPELSAYIHSLYGRIHALNPKLIYLQDDRFKRSFSSVIAERPEEWLSFITWYYTEQGYGKANSLSGVDGLLEVLEQRKTAELAILETLPVDRILLDKTSIDWDAIHEKIGLFLQSG
ncbi:hypothetical protein [Candidatus Pristimantibacillus sp. PTI5]|uniref:hypothetical protein n=1 Tax=Candidatus Pristimantibacillus sp. PTI5 TaxID=3400422 RepID=UPI003B0245C9